MKFEQILKDSNYKLTLFSQAEIDTLEAKITTREVRGKETAKDSPSSPSSPITGLI